ncbi:MAG: TonB-dependent receptor plug domain-containing protein [Bacteroidales bacterium]|nr:TonB-dependent receptor plug domain-containing protein [Bacteroidales bacterium]
MNGRKLIPSVVLLLLLAGAGGFAQTTEYQKDAAELASLFRGKQPVLYPYRFNGTYYLETREFGLGRVWYNGKVYEAVPLNLNANQMELEVRPSREYSSVIPDRNQIAWFSLDGRRFVNLEYWSIDQAREGFYELAHDGPAPLLIYKQKVFMVGDSRQQAIYRDDFDGNYDAGVPNFFGSRVSYFQLEGGRLKKLGKKAFLRLMREPERAGESPLDPDHVAWRPRESERPVFRQPSAPLKGGISLPGGYFEEKAAQDTLQVTYADNALRASYQNKIYNIGSDGETPGAKATVSGTVLEAETGLPLPGVVVFDDNTGTYARTNSRGVYHITLPKGENRLNYNADSKESLALKIVLHSDGDLDIVMSERITLLKGAVVSAESMRQHRNTVLGVESVSMKTLSKIPSAFGEGDVIKAVLSLPGVKSVGEASGGINVRGGASDQNLILYNDNTIYNPNHLFGMFSSFNPDLVDGVELYKSSIPVEYGGRISSVLSVKSKEGDRNRVRGSLGIGLLTSRGHIEGPLGKKTSFIAGARTTYSNWILKLLPEDSAYSGGSAGFTDANLGLTHHFDSRHSLQLFGYFATDRFSFSGDTTFHYTNYNASTTYRYRADDGSSFKLSAGYDHFTNTLGAHSWKSGAYDLQTYIRQAFLKAGGVKKLGSHSLTLGADAVAYMLDPGILTPAGDESQVITSRLDREMGIEPAVYLADNWEVSDQFSVDGGVRLSSFLALPSHKFYVGPEFRLSAKYSPVTNLSFKAGFNTLQQYIHLISNTSSVSPMDTWRLSSAQIKPTTGWQAAGGAYWTLLGSGIDLSLDGYYKQSRNALDYKSGALLSMNPNLADDLLPVRGRAYGVELMAKKTTGRLTGWVSYSYSRSQLREMETQSINHGDWYNAPYDKPHEFKLAGNFAFTHRYSLSLNIDYSTGRPVTVPVGRYYFADQWRLAYSERNGYRIPDYFRMDVAVNVDPGHSLKAFAHVSFTVGVYNVTGRKNPYSVFFRTEPSGKVRGYMLSVFASQIPYINLNVLF